MERIPQVIAEARREIGGTMMSEKMNVVEKQIRLSVQHADRLSRLARAKALSEDQIIEKALEILFSLTDLLDQEVERQGWSFLSEGSLQRVWDNEEDARYDHWRELYGIPAR
jgi:predicted transcriptional regulator